MDRLSCQVHITALYHYDNKLLVGCGQHLEIYCLLSNRLLIKCRVFDCLNVQGIYVYENEDQRFVIVYGNRFFSLYRWSDDLISVDRKCENELDEKFNKMKSNEGNNSSKKENNSTKYYQIDDAIELKEINLSDWILDVQFSGNKIYAMLSSNKMACYDLKTNQSITIECKSIRCTLYTAKFLSQFNRKNSQNEQSLPGEQIEQLASRTEQSSTVAAGTIFSEILICEYTDTSCQIIDRLAGHQGALFSIDYNKEMNLLVSASDDRTVRVWKFDTNTNRFNSLHVLYGHESRIWQVKLTKSCIISCGESSSLIFWSYDGKCLFKEKSKKQSYWRLIVDKVNDRIFYGASDGSVKQRSIDRVIQATNYVELNVKDTKRLKIFGKNQNLNEINLVVSDSGGTVKVVRIVDRSSDDECVDTLKLFRPVIDVKTMCELDFGKEYSNYNVLDVEASTYRGILGNINGEITKFEYSDEQVHIKLISKHKLFDCKLLNIITTQNELITCCENGAIMIWDLENLEMKSSFSLPPAKEIQLINCVLRLSEYLIVFGDRLGNVLVYESKEMCDRNHTISPVKFFKRIHGSNGVKYLAKHPFQNKFYSSGRDGVVMEYCYRAIDDMRGDQLTHDVDLLRLVKIGLIDIDWIARIEFDQHTGELTYVCGFKANLFIVWNNATHSIVWTVDASGGSKEWAFTITSNRLNLIYVKYDKLIHASKQFDETVLIRSKYHTNTVLCAVPLFPSLNSSQLNKKFYFITGSEDCDLFINSLDRLTKSTSIELQLHGHISGVKACCVDSIDNSNDLARSLMISVGGCSQLIGWEIALDREHHLTSKQLVNYFIWGPDSKLNNRPWVKSPKNSLDPQVRFMDVNLKRLFDYEYLIITICSDSTLRLFRLSLNRRHIYLIGTHSLSDHCPLKMINCNELTMVTSTDGSLRVIELRLDRLIAIKFEDQEFEEPEKTKFTASPLAIVINQSDDKETNLLQILHTIRQHQSGINSIDCFELNANKLLVLMAGEDAALGYMVIKRSVEKNQTSHRIDIELKGNCLLAHSAMVSKVKILTCNLLITASRDKRIKIWRFKLDDHKLELKCIQTICSSISDISELIVDRNSPNRAHFVVVGEGREIYEIDFNNLQWKKRKFIL